MVSSTWTSARPSDVLLEADDAKAMPEVRPSVPGVPRGVDGSREVVRQGGGAEVEAEARARLVVSAAAVKIDAAASVRVKTRVKGSVMRLVLIIAASAAAAASPWWLLNGEPRPECAKRPVVSSTWTSARPSDVLLEADDAKAMPVMSAGWGLHSGQRV